jgi:hypothetical protein
LSGFTKTHHTPIGTRKLTRTVQRLLMKFIVAEGVPGTRSPTAVRSYQGQYGVLYRVIYIRRKVKCVIDYSRSDATM